MIKIQILINLCEYEKDDLNPVSYTHLDVYKRQFFMPGIGENEDGKEKSESNQDKWSQRQ